MVFKEEQPDGSVRTSYRFGSAYSSLSAPELPIIRRSSLDDLSAAGRKCLGSNGGALEDALGAIARYEAIDVEAFRNAWHGAMHPVVEHMVIGDPGHRTNLEHSRFAIETDQQMARTCKSHVILLGVIEGILAD